MTERQLAIDNHALYTGRERQDSDQVGNCRAIFAEYIGNLLLGEPEFRNQALYAERLVNRIEIRPLEILDKGE